MISFFLVLKSILDLLMLFIREKPDSEDVEKLIKMLKLGHTPEVRHESGFSCGFWL